MSTFEELIDLFPTKRVLVVGDLMLDRFVYGNVHRISPEAPVQVINANEPEEIVGGCGNVARNVVALGAKCDVIGIVGRDEAAAQIKSLLSQANVNALLVDGGNRITTVKTRYVANLHSTHLLRADREDATAIAGVLEDELLAVASKRILHADILILSDYQKGVLTPRVIAELIGKAREAGKMIIVDPKGSNFARYRGVSALTPNLSELSLAIGRSVPDDTKSIGEAAKELREMTDSRIVLVTRGAKGLLVLYGDGDVESFEATTARQVVDVSGAGDTVVGSFALAISAGAPELIAARLANAAAGIVVSKKSTATVSGEELRTTLLSRPQFLFLSKIFTDYTKLAAHASQWRAEGNSVGFANGCFDLLHPGHVHLLCEARSRCDRLVVALNSDQSVKRLKGENRPVQSEIARAQVMAALAFVDAVIIFGEDTPLELLQSVRPEILIKGADYQLSEVVGRELVESYGGRVSLIELVPDTSTSKIVEKVLDGRKDHLADLDAAE